MSAPETDSNSDPNAHAAPGHAQARGSASRTADDSPSAPPRGGSGDSPLASESAPGKKPWGWIAVAGVLAVGLVAVGVYSINTKSDLDDANAKVASQQQKIASQQKEIDEAQSPGAGAVAAAKAAYGKLSAQLGAAQQNASQTSEQAAAELSQAEQAASDAKGTAEELQKNADAAQAKAEAAATCAQSFLSAFGGVFSGPTLKEGVEATVAELKKLQPQCASALGQGSSGP
jgi:hypothetical protein